MKTDYIIYTDGGCIYNPGGKGGYGVVIIDPDTGEYIKFNGSFHSTTNNRMEVIAAIKALERIPVGRSAMLYSDSKYLVETANGVYSRKKNLDLWHKLDEVRKNKVIYFVWVKGHNNNNYNEICDSLATEAIEYLKPEIDIGYKGQNKQGSINYNASNNFKSQNKTGAMAITINVPERFLKKRYRPTSKYSYADQYKVNPSCAKSILEFYTLEKVTFKHYYEIKTGGRDHWSSKKKDELINMFGEEIWKVIQDHISDQKYAIACLRWYARGMDLIDCIRKILVDMEVSDNCRR